MNHKQTLRLHLHKAAHDPRAAALVALSQTLQEESDSQAALDGVLSSPLLMPTDRGLCTELVYGVLRWYLRLRDFSESFLARPDKLPDEMRLTLCVALYEMAFLRVPHHGPVNWAVSHVRNRFGKGLGGVANGALRSMQRKLKTFAEPDLPLAARFAMPEWIVELWTASYGQERTLALLEGSQSAPPSGLRLNRSRSGWEASLRTLLAESADKAVAVGPCAAAFSTSLPWTAKTLVKEGKASRQSAASYQAVEALEPAAWPGPVWDCCAGRGGKSFILLEQGIAVALASDPNPGRLDRLAEEYDRLGLSDPQKPRTAVFAAQNAASAPEASLAPGEFGTILVDAPCSGLGTLARRPEIRLRRTPESVRGLVRTQRDILDGVWPFLRPGGCLVYLTCTMNPAENGEQATAFVAAQAGRAVLEREFQTPFDSPLHEYFYGAVIRKS